MVAGRTETRGQVHFTRQTATRLVSSYTEKFQGVLLGPHLQTAPSSAFWLVFTINLAPSSSLGSENLGARIASIRLVMEVNCGHICEAFSWLPQFLVGASAMWVVSQGPWLCPKAGLANQRNKPTSSILPWFLFQSLP